MLKYQWQMFHEMIKQLNNVLQFYRNESGMRTQRYKGHYLGT